jgi:hypothetical protein
LENRHPVATVKKIFWLNDAMTAGLISEAVAGRSPEAGAAYFALCLPVCVPARKFRLRAIDRTDERERNERLKLSLSKIEDLFAQPPFVNCAGWDRQSKEGEAGESLIFHGALYFIPILIFYGGGRREEYCGMMTDDVIEDNGAYRALRRA